MKPSFLKCAFPVVIACLFALPADVMGEDAAVKEPADEASGARASFTDPKSAYRSYIEAVRKLDLDAALQCWTYEPEQEEAMKVVAGIWISHRKFEKALDASLGEKADKTKLLGYVRLDMSDKALDAATSHLDTAVVEGEGDTVELDMKWDTYKGDGEQCFLHGDRPVFRKTGGGWKLAAVSEKGSLLGEGDFFALGGWGRMFRDGIAMLDEASAKLAAGEFATQDELAAFLAGKEKAMKERHEQERAELEKQRMEQPKPRPQ